ncbi:hypothetical protein [Agriterribacter sp.]|uniref:hypothetical protein n=1 Tax=Agriterribacter sp. TaxID=2821509 RepID=UPI002B5D1BFE|nr:hypothetical protein [Agriterribacter sp.]HRP57786.1 hypothetical protein [Agriterribacter sp.]
MNKEIRHPLVATTYDGKKAVIMSPGHPHKDKIAVCVGAEYTPSGWAIRWKTVESEESFLTTRGMKIKWL